MTRGWSRIVFGCLLAALVASPASGQDEDDADGKICSNTATVNWQTDLAELLVTGASVEVPGCEDGEYVGIELITDDGDIPPDGPLGGEVEDEVATFNLTDLDVGIEPVTGVRVYLVVSGEPTPVVTITVEQRFFNPAGNEQVGLRVTTDLLVALGDTYLVPSASDRYEDIACSDVGVSPGEPPIAEGAGTFVAQTSGLHLACYQQVAPPPDSPGQPGADEPEVLGIALERDDDDAATVLGQVLARTGVTVGHAVLAATILVLAGALLVRRRKREGHLPQL